MTTAELKQLSPVEKSEAARAKLRAMGIEPKPRGSWRKTIGCMKNAVHFDEAARYGSEWRAEENRRSIEEAVAEAHAGARH